MGALEPSRPTPVVTVLLVLLLVFACGLRLWYANAIFVPHRFWDERFAFENVHQLLGNGWGPPANGYYPTLSYLPQTLLLYAVDRVHRASGDERLAVYRVPEPWQGTPGRGAIAHRFAPFAYALARLLQVLYGTASIYVLYRLGRRLFDPAVGLLAAGVLAATPWHVHASAVFKPDAPLLLTVLLALWAGAVALLEPLSLRRYLVAGLAIAAAMSCKLTGGLVALPLAIGTLWLGWSERRRLVFLAAAGVLSAAAVLLLNPYFRINLAFLDIVSQEYARTAAGYGGTRLGVLRRTLELVYSWDGHGPVFGVLALAGGVVLGWTLIRAARRRTTPRTRLAARSLILLYPLLHAGAYALQTPHFKGNNLLPILPATALWAGWAARALGRFLRARLPMATRHPATVLAVAATAAWVVGTPWRYVYQSLIPTTGDVALLELEERFGPRRVRQILVEPHPSTRVAWEGRALGAAPDFLVFEVQRMDRLPGPARLLADALVFPPERLRQNPGMERRFERMTPRNRWRIEPRLFHRRGPSVAVVVQPLRALAAPEPLPVSPAAERGSPGCAARLPADLAPGDVVSFALYHPGPRPPAVSLDAFPLPIRPIAGKNALFHTRRHALRGEERTLWIEPPPGAGATGDCAVDLYRWGRGRRER